MPESRRSARLLALVRRRDRRDAALAVLVLLLLAMTAYAFRDRLGRLTGRAGAAAGGGEAVSVFDVVVDRKERKFADFLFDRPLGKEHAGEILSTPPATVEPALAGVWRWRDAAVLRFEPSGGFPPASRYQVALIPERLVGEGRHLAGKSVFEVKTDQFLVEGVDAAEEPAPGESRKVIFRGTLRFNYPVRPEQLAPLISLIDPRAATGAPVGVDVESTWPQTSLGFHTDPVEKTKEARTVTLLIRQALTPTVGNTTLGGDYRFDLPVGSSETLAVRTVSAEPGLKESSLRVEFSSPVDAGVAAKYLTVDPVVRYRLAASGNTLSLTGDFHPGETYSLALGKGLPATDEAVLPEDYQRGVQFRDLDPEVDFQSEGMFLAARGAHTVALTSVNVPAVDLAIDRVYLNNLFTLFQYGSFGEDFGYAREVSRALGDRLVDEAVELTGERNRQVVTPVALDPYIEGSAPGFYRVSVTRPGEWQAAQRWLLLTDLGAVAKLGRGELLVWVSSFRDLAPVAGAKVTLLSDQNQRLGEGRTGADGLVRLAGLTVGEDVRPYLVTIEKGNDFTFLLFDRMAVDTTGLDVAGAAAAGEGYTAFLYGERDLYRPGEAVQGLGVVRKGDLTPPTAMPALLRHRDPQGRELETQRVAIDAGGLAPFALDLSPATATGRHSLELEVAETVIGRYGFQVEEFVPDRIKVEVAPGAGAAPGGALAYRVASSYLFGPPAAGLAVETRVRLTPALFAPKGFENYVFADLNRSFDEREIFVQSGALDDAGQAEFSAPVPPGLKPPSSLAAVVTARVMEQGGRGVTAVARLPVDPYPYYLGLRRLAGGYVEPGQEVALEYVAVTPDGKEAPAGGLRMELYLDRWNTVLRRTPSGTYRYESTRDPQLVESQALPAGSGRGRFTVRPSDYGSHRVVLSDPATGASASVSFYASGWGYSPWAIENPARLELDLDRDEYRPGDTAVVQVRAPFPGKLFLSVERDRVFTTEIHRLAGNTAKISLPVSGEWRPNVYVTATLVREVGDLEPGAVGRAFGAVPLSVDRLSNRLAPAVEAPDEIRSARELAIGVERAAGGDGDGGGGGRGGAPAHRPEDRRPVRLFLPQAGAGGDLLRHLQPAAAGGQGRGGRRRRRRRRRRRGGADRAHRGASGAPSRWPSGRGR